MPQGSHEPSGELCYNKKLNKATSKWISGPVFPLTQLVNLCDHSFQAPSMSIHTSNSDYINFKTVATRVRSVVLATTTVC